jgi:two-component system, OmpR family, sensor histidine kinase KdpD
MRRALVELASIAALLGVATALVGLFEGMLGVANADAVYLLAVVAAGVGFGTPAAIETAIGSFLLYNFFFVRPVLTFAVADRTTWLDLFLLLIVGAIVGQLAAAQRNRAEAAEQREREAHALFAVSREFATHADGVEAISHIIDTLASAAGMRSVWLGLGPSPDHERVVVSVGPDAPVVPRIHCVLRPASSAQADWVALHTPQGSGDGARLRRVTTYRVVVEAEGEPCGSLWGVRDAALGPPDPGETRVVSVAAGQFGRAIERRRLVERAASAEVARRSEALKTALLDSVSHDLRTPLASIRAAAGNLMDPDVSWSPDEQREAAATIDGEAERLNELVSNLLDMSRIEAGELVPHPEPFALADVVRECVGRRRDRLSPRTVEIDIDAAQPPVLVDGLFLEQVIGNVLDNVAHHTPPHTRVQICGAEPPAPDRARLVIEDDGPGVPPETLPRLFDKFYRVPRAAAGSRGGTGVGLSVARGLVEAMGGAIAARPGKGGGLAIVIDLPSEGWRGVAGGGAGAAVGASTPREPAA